MNFIRQKIIVTGSSGSLGSCIVRELINLGESVKATSRNPEKLIELGFDNHHVENIRFDYSNAQTWTNAFKDVNQMVVIAPPGDPMQINS